MQPLEVTAFAFPVANGKIDKLELRHVAKIGDGKHGLKDGLQAAVFALAGQSIHLQKAVVGALLNFDEVGNLNCGRDLGKIKPAAGSAFLGCHERLLKINFRLGVGHPKMLLRAANGAII